MRSGMLLVAAWTAIVGALLLFWPCGVPTPLCARLVGRSAACLAELAAANQAAFWNQTVPFVAVTIGGYVLMGLLALKLDRSQARADTHERLSQGSRREP